MIAVGGRIHISNQNLSALEYLQKARGHKSIADSLAIPRFGKLRSTWSHKRGFDAPSITSVVQSAMGSLNPRTSSTLNPHLRPRQSNPGISTLESTVFQLTTYSVLNNL
jgi:hypothetical protein